MDTALAPIVVAGPMGAGKDYVAGRIVAALTGAGKRAEFFALGDYYYDVVAQRHNMTAAEVRAWKPEFRDELQHVGGDPAMQAAAIEHAAEVLREKQSLGITAVVTVRKQSEIDGLRRAGARALAVDAPAPDRIQRIEDRDGTPPTSEQLSHAVEEDAAALKVDVVVPNGANAGDLEVSLVGSKLFMRNARFGFGLDLRVETPTMRAIA